MDLSIFYTQFIEVTDRILPALPHPSDQIIYLQLFSRTIAIDEKTCRLPYRDISELTGLSAITVRTSLRRLIDLGLLRIAQNPGPRTASIYELLWPVTINRYARLQRHPHIALKDIGNIPHENLLNQLTPEDREIFEILKGSLTLEEEKNIKTQASLTIKNGESINTKFDELIILTKFGPERLRKYM